MSSRWEKGQSGNPKGRPRKSKDDALDVGRILKEMLNRKVSVSQGERAVHTTMLEAGLLQMVTQFAKGNAKARDALFRYADKFDVDLSASSNAGGALRPHSKRLIEEFIESITAPEQAEREQASDEFLTDDLPSSGT